MNIKLRPISEIIDIDKFESKSEIFKEWYKRSLDKEFKLIASVYPDKVILDGVEFLIPIEFLDYHIPQMVKKLRDSTGIGMMDAKRTFFEFNFDLERAINFIINNRELYEVHL